MGDKVNILLVDDQPAKLISHTAVLNELGENLLTATSARQAFEVLLKNEIAVVLIDVCMPDTDGFELAAMIQEHPRFSQTAIIFISAILFNDVDRLRGYQMGAVDYVSVPVIPEVLRAKVRVFVELYRKTHQLEQLNRNLEARVAERTAELAASTAQLRQAEQLRSLALAAGQMGSWEWDMARGQVHWDQGQHEIFGVDPKTFIPTARAVKALIHPGDLSRLLELFRCVTTDSKTLQTEFRVSRADGDVRWCIGVVAASFGKDGALVRLSGVTVDITDRKRAEEHRMLLAEEVDHRARNVVAVIQAIMRLTRSDSIDEYIAALDGRIGALSTAHKLLATSRWEGADLRRLVDEELAPYRGRDGERIEIAGPAVMLPPTMAQTIALTLHELVTNAAKYGALSVDGGQIHLVWETGPGHLALNWRETNGPRIKRPSRGGYGTRVIKGGIEGQLGGKAEFDWLPDGLKCRFQVPHQGIAETGANRMGTKISRETVDVPHGDFEPDAAGLILIVEDEPMISMMLADMLIENGELIDGPYCGIKEALMAARRNNLKAGILDVNLKGNAVYPVADILIERKIPFIFVTGYTAEAIDARYNHIPVLQKPIEPQHIWAALQGSSSNAEEEVPVHSQ
ncbi:MAG TPA: HWE histidine kinase domain-containing protein [Pseudolabrys sp.]|nr:HWE histidine kinase domain-containing protein [Pseudolabrys sp.]